ncbi:phospho-N-acetylmuramoyl-pentapeptide-transferase [Kiritimatiella glycovorans]|uniref:Phospho-N-acetylmuramoyl-pentapeptide-transferase n=1 Tax=Kiritimatiella glycovorans TaxID=1307763 RepID=A0A0G3EF84_9BACT|nr:phospho-N-acetylmuramoyl-pentapeptide-transferase [Kiritimatiella glycovorans]AKJ64998.1 Phospho-N-acetylmuramoyl-pentapeptide-transferase [Kiritimatiella glycovorans]
MLYDLHEWTEVWSVLRIFRYITVRTFGAAGTAFVLSLIFGPLVIRRLSQWNIGQQIRGDEVMRGHRVKAGTPTMGGVLIVGCAAAATILWARPGEPLVWCCLATMVFMGAVGAMDDVLKIRCRNSTGLREWGKLGLQGLWALALLWYLWQDEANRERTQQLFIPFLKDPVVPAMGFVFTLVFVFGVMAGSSNAVNLTDGLDGLAVGCGNAAVLAYLVMAYATGHAVFAEYLQIPHVAGAGELAVFCGALLGAGLGFLWFNCHPARVFMGDTGSLAIGGSIAAVALIVKQELVLLIVGGVFVLEALSVILQRGWFKYTRRRYGEGRRIFRCAPLHHHFEQQELARAKAEGRTPDSIENRIVVRFWILAIIFALLGIATLKIR